MASPTPEQELAALITEPAASAARVSAFLDGLSPDARRDASRSLNRGLQRQLWKLVDGFGEIDLEHFVPKGTPALQAVRHYGRNTLPLFTMFEKRFYRAPGSNQDLGTGEQIAGANFQTISPLTGPGYFVCVPVEAQHEVDVDYRMLPTQAPAGWPAIVSNESGVSRFIYGFMADRMRRVSTHVSIGSAVRNGKPLGSWFTLCREP